MDPIVTTMAELIDVFIAADRPAPLGASALSRLAFRHGLLSLRQFPIAATWLALLGVFLAGMLLRDP
jgi:hypothetical protein